MKNVTNKTIKEDYSLVYSMACKYLEAIYENQEGQKAHYDNQDKLVRLAIGDVRAGLVMASHALGTLIGNGVIED